MQWKRQAVDRDAGTIALCLEEITWRLASLCPAELTGAVSHWAALGTSTLRYDDSGVADYPNFDDKRHPAMKNVRPIEVVLHAGESLLIPISVSFTNYDASNQFSVDYRRT